MGVCLLAWTFIDDGFIIFFTKFKAFVVTIAIEIVVNFIEDFLITLCVSPSPILGYTYIAYS